MTYIPDEAYPVFFFLFPAIEYYYFSLYRIVFVYKGISVLQGQQTLYIPKLYAPRFFGLWDIFCTALYIKISYIYLFNLKFRELYY